MSKVTIHPYRPGVIDEVVRHHAAYYGDHWDFDDRFEAQVSREFSEFIREFDASRDGFWWAEQSGTFVGAVAVDGSRSGQGQARLRWFIVPEEFQGSGVGSTLFSHAMSLCRERGFRKVYLWTFAGLEAARTLYERNGFKLVEERVGTGWGPTITEQKFVLKARRTT